VDALTFARRLQLRGQPRFHTAFQFNPVWGTLRERHDTGSARPVNETPAPAVVATSGRRCVQRDVI